MAQDGLEAAIDRLYAVPMEAFVPERTRLARELKSAGERPAAEQVATLRKPTAPAWALNHVAREEPKAVEEWLETVAALREASTHAADVGGDVLRRAMAAHREATARLMDAVRDRARPGGRPLSEAMLDRVRTLLQSATSDAELAERLRAGRITEETGSLELRSAAEPQTKRSAVKPGRSAAKPARRPSERDRSAAARAERKANLKRRVRASQEEVQRLQDEAARREAAAESVDERLEEARRTLRRSESEAAAARDVVEDAKHALAAAERELRKLRGLLRDADGQG